MDVKKEAFELTEKLIEMRRQLHEIPEIAYEEVKTSAYIADKLSELGIEIKTGIAKTGVVGILKGNGKKTIALRADIDALPVTEANNVEYKSKHAGNMHACGHDAHMSMLLGTAMILSKFKEHLKGQVKFIFQPSEESLPGGAKQMIEEGVLDNPKVDAIFGLHCDPTIQTGKIGYKTGALMAFTSEFIILLQGKGGHAADPSNSIDPIIMASDVIQELQKIPSRWVNPIEPVVVTIGSIHGGTTFNIIPEEIELKGTVRLLNTELIEKVKGMINGILKGITSIYGGKYNFNFVAGYPVLVNNKEFTLFMQRIIKGLFGEENAVEIDKPLMVGEDFAYYLQKVPGTFLLLGTKNEEKGSFFPWHHPHFNIDEDALPIGTALFAKCAIEFLK
ncbi:amidohydrolase [candidate division WOR-3 bacterium]|nr:amidohydrolase [candidate division WOR-3 bacterium]